MRISIDLLKLIGAEPMERNRVPGVFIPLVPNTQVVYGKKGMAAYVSIFVSSVKSLKPFDYRGRISIPEEHKDRYLETDTLIKRNPTVAWGWSDKRSSSGSALVSSEEFENLVGD